MRQHVLVSLAVAALACSLCSAQTLLWASQFGSSSSEVGTAVAVDGAGNAYITGYTVGNLGGTNAGVRDVFLTKYDTSGTLLWLRQIGTPEREDGIGVAVDGVGNAYITGHTHGSLGGPNAGNWDVFLVKFDASGALLWIRQIGTSELDQAAGVAVDSTGNVYITGRTRGSLGGPNPGGDDTFLAKFDASGIRLWIRQFDDSGSEGVAVDSAGNAYITGSTLGSFGGPNAGNYDVYLVKYDASGTLLWIRQIGTPSFDAAKGVAVDSGGNAYIIGQTYGSLGGPNAGFWDVFLVKYDASGTLLWTRQEGTSNEDFAGDVAVDSAGNAYITGHTVRSLFGPNLGGQDYYLAKYDTAGTQLWALQGGTSSHELGYGVAVDNSGNAYVCGYTQGSLGGPSAGDSDVFLVKYGCYADCDKSTGNGVLDIFDFLCFQNSFVNAEPYACDCDTSTGPLVCDVFDFLCFQNAFVGGCP